MIKRDQVKKLARSRSVLYKGGSLNEDTKWEKKPLCSYSHLSVAREVQVKVNNRSLIVKAIDSFGGCLLDLCLNKLKKLGLDERLIKSFMILLNITRAKYMKNTKRTYI